MMHKHVQHTVGKFKSGLNKTNQTSESILLSTLLRTGLTTIITGCHKIQSKLFIPSLPLNILSQQ